MAKDNQTYNDIESRAIPLFDGPSKQCAVLLLESCGINVFQCEEGFAIRRGTRGWMTKTLEGTLRDAIDAYRFEGPKSVIYKYSFRLEVASALAGTTDEKPYRELAACYSDAIDMIETVKARRVKEAIIQADLGTPSRTPHDNKVIPFPTRTKT